MAHDFYCECGRWVATCGMAEGHTTPFSFSTTCGCGKSVSGSCGGKVSSQQKDNEVRLFVVCCEHCSCPVAYITGKNSPGITVNAICPECEGQKMSTRTTDKAKTVFM